MEQGKAESIFAKHPRTPPTNNPRMLCHTADSKHASKGSRALGTSDESLVNLSITDYGVKVLENAEGELVRSLKNREVFASALSSGIAGKGSIIGTFGASSSAYGTNNKLVKLKVLVIGEYNTLRFVRKALSRATLDMSLLETRLVFHYSYKDTTFMVFCDALKRPNMIVMDHNFVVQLGRDKIKILVDG
ncbi:unnamed protein product [Prunus armeniaca]|uniref:Uncharacterized protein n=2 Tax=Prunus armeniaca TaxID=36596 RepID=A0A6J5WF81_PRUAR|nr:unnamed protein product [Prunus armeniaca]